MSEKEQHTTAKLRLKMVAKYGNELHHKHNKLHSSHRKHWKSHPINTRNGIDKEVGIFEASGMIRELNLQKIRKRMDKGRYH